MSHNIQEIQGLAQGHWSEILQAAGIGPEYLTNSHGPCPLCGGKDRFHFDNQEDRGTYICNQCGAGDGLTLLSRHQHGSIADAARFVAEHFGVTFTPKTSNWKLFFDTPARVIDAWPTLPLAKRSHPYLVRKGILPIIARQNVDELIIPLYSDLAGTLVSAQRILPNKDRLGQDKYWVKGTPKKGNFCLLDCFRGLKTQSLAVLFCEGFATGVSLHLATELPVIICFDAGNIPQVAAKLKDELSNTKLVYCADDDPDPRIAATVTKHIEKAIKQTGGVRCLPLFKARRPDDKDFNDLADAEGLETVKAQVMAAINPPAPELQKAEPRANEQGTTEEKEEKASQVEPEKQTDPDEPGPTSKRFSLTRNKLFCNQDGDWIPVCDPLKVEGITVSQHGDSYGRLLSFQDFRKNKKTLVIEMGVLAGDGSELTKTLLNKGLKINSPFEKSTKQRLAEYINDAEPTDIYTTTDSTGWHGQAFVLTGGEVIGKGDKILFTGADTDIYAGKGTLNGWQNNLASILTGNSRLVFATSLAFAGPLMPLTGDDGAGCNFYGLSSTGKTTTQVVAASVWGSPEPGGFISKWNATATGLEIQALQRNHTLFCIDELGEVEPKIAGRLIYQLASGVQKGRGKASESGIGLAALKTWKMPFMSSAEKTLAQHVEDGGARLYGGQAVRCVDIPADAGAGFGAFEDLHGLLQTHNGNAEAAGSAFADLLKAQAKLQHGTAGRAFIAALLKFGTENTLAFIAQKRAAFNASIPDEAGGLVRRAGKFFSLAAAAGELAIHLKILPWTPGSPTQSTRHCYLDWLKENGNGNPEERAALSQLAYFIESNRGNFRGWHESDVSQGGRNISRQVGYMSEDEATYYIMPEIFKKDACKGYRLDFVLKLLKDRNSLQFNRDSRYEIKKPGCRYAYAVNLEKLTGETGESGETTIKINKNNIDTFPRSIPAVSPEEFSPLSPVEKSTGDSFPAPKAPIHAGFPGFPGFPAKKQGATNPKTASESSWQASSNQLSVQENLANHLLNHLLRKDPQRSGRPQDLSEIADNLRWPLHRLHSVRQALENNGEIQATGAGTSIRLALTPAQELHQMLYVNL